MKQINQVKPMSFIEALFFKIFKAAAYTMLALAVVFVFTAFYIGMREMPSRIDYAKNQYMEFQGLKDKNQVNSKNE